MQKPLKNLNVLDLSRLLPGPYASLVLAELGTNVLKVENTGSGDQARYTPPIVEGESILFHSLNRGKKNISIKLNCDEGRKIIFQLVKKYDIVLESYRPGIMDKMGLSYEELKKANPKVILCSITGYGQSGPYSSKAGHDVNFQALSGLIEMTGNKNGPPVIPGGQIADISGGSQAAVIAILSSVIGREHTGLGTHLDISMLDNMIPLQPFTLAEAFAGETPKRGDSILQGRYICYNIYETKDNRHMAFAALEPKFFSNFLKAINREDLIGIHYSTTEEDSEGYKIMREIFRGRTRDEWVELLKDVDACCCPVLSPNELEDDPHLNTRSIFGQQQLLPNKTITQTVAVPAMHEKGTKLEKTAGLGKHTREILLGLGYNSSELDEMAKEGLIYCG